MVPRRRGEKGMIALLATALPHGWMEDIKKMDIPHPGGSAAPVRPGLFGCHPRTAGLGSLIFLDAAAVSDSAAASATRL